MSYWNVIELVEAWEHAPTETLLELEQKLEAAAEVISKIDPEPRLNVAISAVYEILTSRDMEWTGSEWTA